MVKFQPAGNANRFGVMRFNVKFQDVRVLEYVFAPWTAHLNIVMNPHVDVEKIRVFKLLVACAALEHVARGILVLFDFVDLERTRGGEALATVRAHPHSEKRKSQGSVSVQKYKKTVNILSSIFLSERWQWCCHSFSFPLQSSSQTVGK